MRCAKPGKRVSKDAVWTRRDPDLTILHGDPEFERLYPETSTTPQSPSSSIQRLQSPAPTIYFRFFWIFQPRDLLVPLHIFAQSLSRPS